jgi:NAD(P)H-nitrite reductase large subunit
MFKNDEMICHCNEITYQTIIDAMKQGIHTVDDLIQFTNAGTACGYCIETLEEILEEIQK